MVDQVLAKEHVNRFTGAGKDVSFAIAKRL